MSRNDLEDEPEPQWTVARVDPADGVLAEDVDQARDSDGDRVRGMRSNQPQSGNLKLTKP